ncbi:MAG: hypothetical protein EP338_01575 [Bacteroidetes bacterium]|nr:MAG: hypothetical protein EP338_01575 [Bacteroidota bacterium]
MNYLRLFCFCISLFFAPFMWAQNKADVVLSMGHTDQINCLEISPDGKWMLTGGNDNLVKLWDMASGKEMRSFTGNDGRMVKVRFSPDGKYMLGLNYQEQINVWNKDNGQLVRQFKSDTHNENFEFTEDGKNIVFYDTEAHLTMANMLSGEVLARYPIDALIRFVKIPGSDEIFYFDHKGAVIRMDLQNGKELKRVQLFNELHYPVCRLAIDEKGEHLAVCYEDNQIHVYETGELKEVSVMKEHQIRIRDICYSKEGKGLLSVDHNRKMCYWNSGSHKLLFEKETPIMGGQYLAVHPTEPLFYFAEFKKLHYVSLTDGKILKTLVPRANSIVSMDYAQNGKYLATAANDISIKVWDLSKNRIVHTLQGFFPVAFSPAGNTLVCMRNAINLVIYDSESGKEIKSLNTEGELIQNLSFSKDGKYVSGAGYTGTIRIWNLEEGKVVARLQGHQGGIYATSFHPNGKELASAGMDQSIRVWDWKNEKQTQELRKHEILVSDVDYSPDGKYLASASWDKKVLLWSTASWEVSKELTGHVNSIHAVDFSADSKYLASCAGSNTVSEADNSIRVWDVASGEMKCLLENPEGQVKQVIFDDHAPLIYSSGSDGYVRVWDLTKCAPLASLASVGVNDHIIHTPDYYYTASAGALASISFRIGSRLFPFEQFDIRLNRPDVIAERLGKTPENLVKAYRFVYQKRLKKLDFQEEQLGEDFHLPELSLVSEPPVLTRDSILTLDLSLEDSRYQLDRLLVYLNGVPVFGKRGIDLRDRKSQKLKYQVKVPLMAGNNHLRLSCLNEKGSESLISGVSLLREGNEKKHDLYLVSVGVSKYLQSNFNLNYAAKDAQDIQSRLGMSKQVYRKIHQLTLTNEEVTREMLPKIEAFLKKAGINDAVVLFFAGHGVLDEQFNYYFASYDMDFNQPQEKGLSYEQIEALLEEIKPVRKLLLLDTCHSGEIDKEEVEKQRNKVYEEDVKFRAVGDAIASKEHFGVSNMQELADLLFTQSSSGSGATVISSSGGAEFAMESSNYQNGLFTYALLNSMSSYETDLDRDGYISIREWSQKTLEEVQELSKGMQRPTSRATNLQVPFYMKRLR